MANPMFKGKGPGMVAGSFPTNFPLKHAQKDMRYSICVFCVGIVGVCLCCDVYVIGVYARFIECDLQFIHSITT